MTDREPESIGRPFSDRVIVLFITQVVTAGFGIINGFVLARLLGPSAKGDYYLLTLLPTTIMVAIQLGLPQAFGYFAARGQTEGLTRKAVLLALALSLPALGLVVVALPSLETSFLGGIAQTEVLFALAALPMALAGTFTTGIVLGKQRVRWYAAVSVGQVLAYSALMFVFVGALGWGLTGALIVFVAVIAIQSAALLLGSVRATAERVPDQPRVRASDLFRYGLPLFPATLTSFFSNRVDVFLLAALLADPSAPLGYYSMGVSMAEMVFFFPNAVSLLFFPHVAGAHRSDADRQVPTVSRVTLLLTAVVAVALVPVATALISVILPAFTPALPALYLLLPGVVALSVTKVLTGYLNGLGHTTLTSGVSVFAFVLNVAVNLILIPRYGILGAATASLISYSVSSVLYTVIAARLSGATIADFWLPRADDVRFAARTILDLSRRLPRSRPAER